MPRSTVTALALYLLINAAFVYKYSSRVTDLSWLLVVAYSIAIVVVSRRPPLLLRRLLQNRGSHWTMVVITVIAGIALWQLLPPASLRVDRWSVISSFLDSLLAGQFPYQATSHLNNPPGPFPVYYALALPFYLIGEIGYLTVLGSIGLVWVSRRHVRSDAFVGMSTLLLFLSLAWWWELTVRSTLIVNMVLVMAYLVWLSNSREQTATRLILLGLAGGLLVSTRGIVGVIMLGGLSWFYFSTRQFQRTLILAASMGMGFAMTLVPFIVWDAGLFARYNPITLQAGFLPTWVLLAIAGVMAVSGLWIRDMSQYFSLLGHALFLIVFVSLARTVGEVGWIAAIRDDGFDISYFMFALPFLIVTVASRGPAARTRVAGPS